MVLKRPRYYILIDHFAMPTSMEAWSKWFGGDQVKRVVKQEKCNGAFVSTVFLGIDHNFHESGPAHIFETLVFGSSIDGAMNRYPTWSDAEKGHAEMVERVRNS